MWNYYTAIHTLSQPLSPLQDLRKTHRQAYIQLEIVYLASNEFCIAKFKNKMYLLGCCLKPNIDWRTYSLCPTLRNVVYYFRCQTKTMVASLLGLTCQKFRKHLIWLCRAGMSQPSLPLWTKDIFLLLHHLANSEQHHSVAVSRLGLVEAWISTSVLVPLLALKKIGLFE